MKQIVIINKLDVSLPEVKRLMANHGWTVIHDDEMPRGWVAYVDQEAMTVVTVDMHSEDKKLWLVK